MKTLELGHHFTLTSLDGELEQHLVFVKRVGIMYPGNGPDPHPGTTTQEVLRALIARLKYVNNQIPCAETQAAIHHLRSAILLMEIRAKRRKDKTLDVLLIEEIEHIDTCRTCGHIFCTEEGH